MDNARVGVVEDHLKIRNGIKDRLEAAQHTVPFEAATEDEAVTGIRALSPGSLDVLLVDANLSKGSKNGVEGANVIKAAREVLGDMVAIVGISLTDWLEGADVEIPKSNREALVDYVNEL